MAGETRAHVGHLHHLAEVLALSEPQKVRLAVGLASVPWTVSD
jgi:hypothetical protein